jgi:hypothetical protein
MKPFLLITNRESEISQRDIFYKMFFTDKFDLFWTTTLFLHIGKKATYRSINIDRLLLEASSFVTYGIGN